MNKRKVKAPHHAQDAALASESPIVEEYLPLKYVHYPNHYGVFMAFSHDKSENPLLCSCCESAIANYIRLKKLMPRVLCSIPLSMAPLDSGMFPDSIAKQSLDHHDNPMSALRFQPKLCHRCNMAVPSMRYCTPMYGGEFKQAFGWYIKQNFLRAGVGSYLKYIPDVCPHDIQDIMDELRELTDRSNKLSGMLYDEEWPEAQKKELQHLEKVIPKYHRKLWNIFENETRTEFGMRKIGEAWVGENILYQIVVRLFPQKNCIRHLRPAWLEGLELDIFIEEESIAFEYQGQQHYYPVEHWGGQKALDELRARDERKAELCLKEKILLVTIDYTEPLTEIHIQSRIREERDKK
ncbi:MAG: hypothetical protein PHP44_14475 [Kiritimatiellae bacterium]|nr:hypothetical protein [Kiritimatiellia bacterium]MDD4737298.1 hypothetical protein [Kiritimatiellia bacterium]